MTTPKRKPTGVLANYATMLKDIKGRIRTAQVKATLAANQEMILLYWDIGSLIAERQKQAGWGAGIIPRLACDIHSDMPEVKGFSERNIGYMVRFAQEYGPHVILQQPVAKLPDASILPPAVAKLGSAAILQPLVAKLPWGHNVLLMEKIKDISARGWYMHAVLQQGWSRDVLSMMIDSRAHERQGKAVTNFAERLPPVQSDLAQQVLKDPFIFDFLTLEEPFHEHELETSLVKHLEKFLIELGQGFAFVGRQVHVEVGDEDFYIDLLFYHLRLRCFVVIELKKGAFKAEYAGKLNFYLNVVDDKLRHATDNPSVGLILCQDEKRLVAEYALKGMRKAIGVSQYQLTRALPKEFKSSLPSVAEIEAEMSAVRHQPAKSRRRS